MCLEMRLHFDEDEDESQVSVLFVSRWQLRRGNLRFIGFNILCVVGGDL